MKVESAFCPTLQKNKKKSFYRSSALYVECQFDTTLLPMKLNLPMVYPPADWSYDYSQVKEKEWFNISYLYGGCLNAPTKEIYDRYHLLSSGDVTNYELFTVECSHG